MKSKQKFTTGSDLNGPVYWSRPQLSVTCIQRLTSLMEGVETRLYFFRYQNRLLCFVATILRACMILPQSKHPFETMHVTVCDRRG
jgi:hypothetical protein